MTTRIDWPHACVVMVLAAICGALVCAGKAPAPMLLAFLTYLAPGPVQRVPLAAPEDPNVH